MSDMKEIEELENGKLVFHSYEALKKYCDNKNNPLDKVVLGKEITALNSEDRSGRIRGLFAGSDRTNEQFSGIADWDVSKVEKMSGMFAGAHAFNQPLDNWDVSNVTDMNGMFCGAKNFNQPLNNWDVSNVTDMHSMFCGAKTFNQPLSSWGIEDYNALGLPKNYEDKFKNRDKLLSTVDTDTKSKIKQILDNAVNALNNKKTNSSDCDWIFDDCKEMIIDAVNKKLSLSAIVKAIDTASTYTHTNTDGTKKVLKVTITKLTRWLKTQGIKREVRRCAKKVIKKNKNIMNVL